MARTVFRPIKVCAAWTFALLVAATSAVHAAPSPAPAHSATQWLVVSDIHLDPFDRDEQPSLVGSDTNLALFDSSVAMMRRNVPNPAVVVIAGDFLAHDFPSLARRHGLRSSQAALSTMRLIESSFARAYPRAQFIVAVGNNDSPCGDYRSDAGNSYERALAKVWQPLVDGRSEAPTFMTTFVAGGYYIAQTRAPRFQAVVLNSVPLSGEYRGACGRNGERASVELAWLQKALKRSAGVKTVLIMHIPPGYDAFTTQRIHGFVPWRFLNAADGAALESSVRSEKANVAFGIAGHAHRFDFRLLDDVPIYVVGSISPVYHNDPSFYSFTFESASLPKDIVAYDFDEETLEWRSGRSFDRAWRVRQPDASTLRGIHDRLQTDAAMRSRWDAQSAGWPSQLDPAWSMWGDFWKVAWCAQDLDVASFARCGGISGRATVTYAAIVGIVVGLVAVVALGVVLAVRRLRRLRRL